MALLTGTGACAKSSICNVILKRMTSWREEYNFDTRTIYFPLCQGVSSRLLLTLQLFVSVS